MTVDATGGAWTYALTLAEALQPHGVEFLLATMGRLPDVRQRRAAARCANVTLATSEYKVEWMHEPWGDVKAAGEWLLELEAAFEPDVVHLNGYTHAALPWKNPTLVVAHSSVLSWWRAVIGVEAPPSWNRYRMALREGLKAANLVVAPSRAMLAELGREHGIMIMRHARMIPNGADADRYWTAAKEPFVLSAGRLWDDAKNVAALDHVADRSPWPVYVVGDSHHPDGTTRVFEHAHVLEAMAPEVLGAWMACASVYALPARYEPFGLSVLEAALSGCALVLGDIPSLRENWEGAALFVPPGDDAALVEVLRDLARLRALRWNLASASLARARSEFGLAPMASGYLKAYQDLRPAISHAQVA